MHVNQRLNAKQRTGQSLFTTNMVQNNQVARSTRPKSRHKPKKGLSLRQGMVWGIAFALTTTLSATLGATVALVTPFTSLLTIPFIGNQSGNPILGILNYQVSRPVTILVMGVDRVLDVPDHSAEIFSGRSDTMLLLHLDPRQKSFNILSIPRDTQVYIPGLGVSKVNAANAYGGPALAGDVLRDTMNGLTIDRYLRVSTEAFRELVDLLGGVEVFVPQRMSYVDQTQKLKIDLSPGWQTLNGEQAEQFVRFRHDVYGDIGRVQRQQTLIKALRHRLVSPMVIPKVPQIVNLMQKYVDTNLSIEEILAIASLGLQLDNSAFRQVLLPGRFSEPNEYAASYWIIDTAGRDRVLQTYFNGESLNANAGVSDGNTPLNDLQIAVQNASENPQSAKQLVQSLRQQGFTNVFLIEDWSDRLQKTQIIAQSGDLGAANQFHEKLGLGQVEASSTGELGSDLTIRVGNDWQATP